MNRQFVFRMQGQETESKRPTQPDFKIRSTENQRSNISFNNSTMYQRPSQLQMNEYEGENMTSLHAKLHQEADKIRKWKVQTELEIKEKDKKLISSSAQIETMKKSLLELQLDNERLSSRMQDEIDDRQEVMQKLSSTRELCNVLKLTANSLEDRMLRCETEKTELKYTGRETSQFLEELSKKFENLQLSSESNHQQLLTKYETEMTQKQERERQFTSTCEQNTIMINTLEEDVKQKNMAIEELKSSVTEKNGTLERLNESLGLLDEKNKLLGKELKIKENDFKESAIQLLTLQDEKHELEDKLNATEAEVQCLQEAKDMLVLEMTASNTKHGTELLSAQEDISKLEKGLEEEQNKLEEIQKTFQEALTTIEKLKSSRDILMLEKSELEMKIELQNYEVSNLKADVDERKQEMHRVDGEMNVLLKRLDKENLCKLHFQEIEKDLEAKLCAIHLEKDELSNTVLQLEEKLKSQENELTYKLEKETEKTERQEADICLKNKELEDGRSQITDLKEELVQTKEVIEKKDSELHGKCAEIERLQHKIEEHKTVAEQCQNELKETKEYFDNFKQTYEDEKKRTDELSNQLKDMNLENKEHGKSLTSQQKKLAVQTKQNKELEKEVKALKANLNLETKKNKETDKALESLEKEVAELKQTNDNLSKSTANYEKEMAILRDECRKDKLASEETMHKAKEMQAIAKKETENAKALTECQLTEMMGTLDSYKQSSEKILADKDAEVRNLKSKLEALEAKNQTEKDELKEKNTQLSSNIKVLSDKKEELCKQLMETADENKSLKNKLHTLKSRKEKNTPADRSSFTFESDALKTQPSQEMPVLAPVTPSKQQTLPWIPKTPIQQQGNVDQSMNDLKTPQRSILRPTSSISKRRKVAFLPDNNDDAPSSSDDLMELEVDSGGKVLTDKFVASTPVFTSRTPMALGGKESALRLTPKRVSTPLSKVMHTSTPRKGNAVTPNVGTFTPVSKPKDTVESKKPEIAPKTPNIRNTKRTSKFFSTSPKDKANSRTRMKGKAKGKKETDGQLSWFDLDSVYGFDPED